MVPVRLRLPMAYSAITSGIDQMNKKNSHGTRNVPPPLAPTIRGNRQMLPVPIAAPMEAKIRPIRPLNWSDSSAIHTPPQAFSAISTASEGSISVDSGAAKSISSPSESIIRRHTANPPQTKLAVRPNMNREPRKLP